MPAAQDILDQGREPNLDDGTPEQIMVRRMTRVLVTGMSGAGKSTVLAELARRGHRVVDTDHGGWIEEFPDPDGPGVDRRWRQEVIDAVLAEPVARTLFVSGTVSNQGRFYPGFHAIVLLTAPLEVLLARWPLATRTTTAGPEPSGTKLSTTSLLSSPCCGLAPPPRSIPAHRSAP